MPVVPPPYVVLSPELPEPEPEVPLPALPEPALPEPVLPLLPELPLLDVEEPLPEDEPDWAIKPLEPEWLARVSTEPSWTWRVEPEGLTTVAVTWPPEVV